MLTSAGSAGFRSQNGLRNIYLQFETLAGSEYNGGNEDLATAPINENTPSEEQEEAVKAFLG